jgi:hypothetical protein
MHGNVNNFSFLAFSQVPISFYEIKRSGASNATSIMPLSIKLCLLLIEIHFKISPVVLTFQPVVLTFALRVTRAGNEDHEVHLE